MGIKLDKPIKLYSKKELWGYSKEDKMIFIPEMVNQHYYGKQLFDYDDDYTSTVDRFWNRFLKKRLGDDNINRFNAMIRLGFNPRRFDTLEVLKKSNAKMVQDFFWVDFGDGEFEKEYTLW